MTVPYDVIVVGKGNAALCAALSAHENGAKVLVLEAAPDEESGGNSRFAGGVMRFAYESVDDLKRVTELTDEEIAASDFGTNTARSSSTISTGSRATARPRLVRDPGYAKFDTMACCARRARASCPITGGSRAWSAASANFSAACRSKSPGGGAGLVQYLDTAAKKAGIEVRYERA